MPADLPSASRRGLAFLLVAFCYLYRLDTPILWNDEADTAAIGQSVLRTGLPYAFAGENLIAVNDCERTGPGLISTLPWLPYYISAASQAAFGKTTRGARLGFAILGLLTFFPLLALLRTRTPNALALTTLLMLSPQTVLLQRNARYYPIVTLLFTTLLWVLFTDRLSQRSRWLSSIACSTLLFHAHPLAALSALTSLTLAAALFKRESLGPAWIGVLAGLVSWMGLPALSGSLTEIAVPLVELMAHHPRAWFDGVVGGIGATALDLDFCNTLPWVALILAVAGCYRWQRARLGQWLRDPLTFSIAATLASETLLISATIGFESDARYALLRYLPHLILLLPMPLYLLLVPVLGSERRALAALGLVSVLNLFGISAWRAPDPARRWRLSWWAPVFAELLNPPPDGKQELVNALSEDPERTGRTVAVVPDFLTSTFIFALGDRFTFLRSVTPGSSCEQELARDLGPRVVQELRTPPDSILAWFATPTSAPTGYRVQATIPYLRGSADGTRPELPRHRFLEPPSDASQLYWYVRAQSGNPRSP